MVKSSGESSGMGYQPHVVAEPYGGLWVKTLPPLGPSHTSMLIYSVEGELCSYK